jgi:hypothetical protein
MSNLSTVDLKIKEIIDILLLHPEVEAPPENYRELGEHLVKFKLQNSQDSLEDIFSMVSTFEVNRGRSEEFVAMEDDEPWDEEDIDESGGEPDNEEFWDEEPEETSGAYSDDEAEHLSAQYNQKYYKKHENSCSHSTLTSVEHNVVLGLILQTKRDAGGYNEEFLTTMQDKLQLAGFSTPQIWEIMTQDLNPESQRFTSADIQSALQQESGNSHEHN